jgi:hypothetical protein
LEDICADIARLLPELDHDTPWRDVFVCWDVGAVGVGAAQANP